MERDRKIPRASRRTTVKAAALELRPERAFVLHLDAHARPPRRVAGRIEHITSGRLAHITSVRELLEFLEDVLSSEVRGEERKG